MAKKQTNEEKIVAALDALDEQVRGLRKFGASYDKYIDEAGLHNNKQRVSQLIKQKISVYAAADRLNVLKSNLMLGASSAQIAVGLSTLDAAISGCKGLLAKTPNFDKLNKNVEKVFKDINATSDAIDKLNGVLDKALTPQDSGTLASRLDGTSEIEESDQYKAEYAAMMERIKGQITPDTVAKPASIAEDITGDVDIAGIIAEENKKK